MKIDGTYKCRLCFDPDGIPLRLERNGELTLYWDDDQLKGSMFPTFYWLNCPFRNGKLEGNKFSFTVFFSSPCQQFAMDVKGEVFEDGSILGEATTPTGPYVLTGMKVSE